MNERIKNETQLPKKNLLNDKTGYIHREDDIAYERDDINRMVNEGLAGGQVTKQNGLTGRHC